jgi:hypothetical protein
MHQVSHRDRRAEVGDLGEVLADVIVQAELAPLRE